MQEQGNKQNGQRNKQWISQGKCAFIFGDLLKKQIEVRCGRTTRKKYDV